MSDQSTKKGEKLVLLKTIKIEASKFNFFRCLQNEKNLLADLTK